MGWLVALGLLLLLAVIPVGISLIYDEDGLFLSLLVGAVQIKLFPKSKMKKPERQKKKRIPKSNAAGTKQPAAKKKGGKLSDFLPLIEVIVQLLGSFCRKIRVKQLELNLVLAADDPCDLAVHYGKAWAAAGNQIGRAHV